MDWWRRWFRWIELLVLIGVAGAAWWRVSYREGHLDLGMLNRPLRVGVASWPGYGGGIMANGGLWPTQDSIFWRGFGDSSGPGRQQLLVEFVIVDDPKKGFEALGKGGTAPDGLDLMWSTIDAWAERLPHLEYAAKAIIQVDWSHGGDAIVAGKEIKRIEDLKGKRIVLPSYGPSRWLLESALRHSALRDDQDALRSLRKATVPTPTPQEALRLFRDGGHSGNAPDAAVLWEPFVTRSR